MAQSGTSSTFELGLVMAGAISGGAYAAGVMDFLIQALDAWEREKSAGANVPGHEVRIRVMSGASAGAIAAAIAAVSFGSETEPVVDVGRPPSPERNRLFDAWVRRIDIEQLLAIEPIVRQPGETRRARSQGFRCSRRGLAQGHDFGGSLVRLSDRKSVV